MSFLSRTQGQVSEGARRQLLSEPATGVADGKSVSRQSRKRITKPLADPVFMDEVLSQMRAARMKRIPPDPM
jgi:hypothetical protein